MLLRAEPQCWSQFVFVAGALLYGADRPITVALVPDGLTPEEREPLQAYLTKAMGRPVNLVAPDIYSETVARWPMDLTISLAWVG